MPPSTPTQIRLTDVHSGHNTVIANLDWPQEINATPKVHYLCQANVGREIYVAGTTADKGSSYLAGHQKAALCSFLRG